MNRLRVYIDIAHPAYAHALRYFITQMKERGHQVLVSARDKDITLALLNSWGIDYICRGRKNHDPGGRQNEKKPAPVHWWKGAVSLAGKMTDWISVTARLLPVVKRFSPDVVISYSSYHAALIGRLLGKPVLTFEDTEHVQFLHTVNRLLSTRMVTPACFEKDFGRDHIRFEGYKELASLHPARFVPLPLPQAVQKPYILIRFVSWMAFHDRGHQGMSDSMKCTVAERLQEFGSVYISSEKPLLPWMEKFRMPVDPEMGHSVLAGASLLFAESASMAAEAAVLGVPAIYIDNTGRGYTRELEGKYKLMFGFGEDDSSVKRALDKAVALLGDPGVLPEWQKRRKKMLAGKVDLTAWMTELAEDAAAGNLPRSSRSAVCKNRVASGSQDI